MSPLISFITSWRCSSSILWSASVRWLEPAVFAIEGDTAALGAGTLAFALAFPFATVFTDAFTVAFTARRGLDFAVMRVGLHAQRDQCGGESARQNSSHNSLSYGGYCAKAALT